MNIIAQQFKSLRNIVQSCRAIYYPERQFITFMNNVQCAGIKYNDGQHCTTLHNNLRQCRAIYIID